MTIESRRASAFPVLMEAAGFLVVAVRTVPATAFAAVATFQVVLLCKHDIAFRAIVEVFGIQLFFKHRYKDIIFLMDVIKSYR